VSGGAEERCAVGISAAVDTVRWGPWEEEVTMQTRAYSRAVQGAGGIALLLPPDAAVEEAPDGLLDRIDGLIISGGSDVGPRCYGEEPDPHTSRTLPERDHFELALARRALERDLPLLGICRGMQVLNVALGGTLVQHLPDLLGHGEHLRTPGVMGTHEVRLAPGSLAARAAGAEAVEVKSHHHQGVDSLGEGLLASGWAVSDEIVEAVERPDRRFALGVLWHPEADTRSRVIGALVDAVREEVAA
jgi:putative glutamine amidotransferase